MEAVNYERTLTQLIMFRYSKRMELKGYRLTNEWYP